MRRVQQMSRFGGGASAGNLDVSPEGGGRRGQELGWGEGGRTVQATYCFACNLLLSLPPPAFLKNNNLKLQRNPVRWRFCIWRATSFKCERARREGGMGVELGRRCLLLPPPPPPPPRRLGEEGGGQSGRRGGWVLLCNFSPGASTRRRVQTGPPRRCGGGGPAGTRLPPRPRVCMRRPPSLPSPP